MLLKTLNLEEGKIKNTMLGFFESSENQAFYAHLQCSKGNIYASVALQALFYLTNFLKSDFAMLLDQSY